MANFRVFVHLGLKNTKSHKSNTRKNTREQKKTSHKSFVYLHTCVLAKEITALADNPHMETIGHITRFHMGIYSKNPHMEMGNSRYYPFLYGDFCF